MKHKVAATIFSALLFAVSISTVHGRQQSQRSSADQQKLQALDDALRNGLLTQAEYDAKLRELNAAQQKTEALNEAHRSGLLTKEEYDAKLRELNAGAGAPNSGSAPSMKVFRIFDPVLGMDFFRITLPSNWLFQGGLVRQSSCSVLVSHFFRASGPAGLYGVKMLPRFDWAWSTDAPYTPGP